MCKIRLEMVKQIKRSRMKVVFLGTPDFGKICLEYILKSRHKVIAAICSNDKKCGRGNKLTPPCVKTFAQENCIPVFQFSKIRLEGVELLKKLKPDIMVTASFGQILSQEILNIAPVLNVHGSLLPKYRGPAPVQYALLNGEKKTGVTIMRTNIGIDDGDIFLSEEIEIAPEDNTQTLMTKLAHLGGKLVVKALDLIEEGKAVFKKQNHAEATFTKMLKNDTTKIDFSKSAEEVCNFIRAYNPDPSAHFVYKNQIFKAISAKVSDKEKQGAKPGEIIFSSPKDGLVVACGNGNVEIVSLVAAGGKTMSAKSYLNGKKMEIGGNLIKDDK